MMCLCPVGMATSQTITSLTACQTKEQNLQMECKFSKDTLSKMPIICSYELDKKVVASSNNSKPVDATYKDRGTAIITGETCMLELKGFSDDSPKTYICNIQQDKSVTQELSVEKSKIYIYVYHP